MADYGAGLKGAAGGAASGAALGSIVPGIGTGIGAAAGGIIGGLGGLFGDSGQTKPAQYQDRDAILARIRQGYGAGGITSYSGQQMDPNSQFRQAQLQQLGQLRGIASGQQQGAGELAVQRQSANAAAQQQALARMARGGGAGLAYRNAANQTAANALSASGAGQQAALQDQQNAQGMLAQVGAAGRQGDFNVGSANASNAMNANQLNSQGYLGLLGQLGGMDANQLNGQNAANIANAQQSGALTGGLLSTAGQLIGAGMSARSSQPGAMGGAGSPVSFDTTGLMPLSMSDRLLKTNVQPGDAAAQAVTRSLPSYTYQYSDPNLGAGPQLGVMAQDLERSGLGQAVINTPRGKAVDPGKLTGANTAMIAALGRRLDKIERAPNQVEDPRVRDMAKLLQAYGNSPIPVQRPVPTVVAAPSSRVAIPSRAAQIYTPDTQFHYTQADAGGQ